MSHAWNAHIWHDRPEAPMSETPQVCSHRWINPADPPIERATYSPWIGPRRREMKYDVQYECHTCGELMKTPAPVKRPA